MACSSGCPTQDHRSYGECLRSKRQMVAYCRSAYGADASKEKLWQRELNLYKEARDAGIQPDGTGMSKIRFAMDQSEKHGMRYGTDFSVAPDGKGGVDAVSYEMVKAVTAEIDKSADMKMIRETARDNRNIA